MANDTTPATKADLDEMEARLKLHFDFSVEQLTVNFRGIFNDRTVDLKNARDDHERRLKRLERHVGLFA